MITATRKSIVIMLLILTVFALQPNPAAAHCDALDGPVVQAAKSALEKGDVTPVLKWVQARDEKEIREAFAKTLKVRALGNDGRDLADRHFFETLVRMHRAGEGVAYSGLKPAGSIDPGIAAADRALTQSSADKLAAELGQAVADGIRDRYAKVVAAKAHEHQSVAAGRAYVAAYVEFIHYVEAASALASKSASKHQHIHAPDR